MAALVAHALPKQQALDLLPRLLVLDPTTGLRPLYFRLCTPPPPPAPPVGAPDGVPPPPPPPRGGAAAAALLEPAELLVALHSLDPQRCGLPMKRIVEAVQVSP